MEKISCIYQIKSKINGKKYIGSAINYNRRVVEHKKELKANCHHSIYLQRHFNKYSIDDLVFSIVEIVLNQTDLIKREQYYINTLIPYFNMCKIAGSTLGFKHSYETKVKMSKSKKGKNKGKKMSEEQKEFLKKYHLGKRHSEETKLKMSNSRSGIKNKMYGKKHTIEAIEKMRLSKIGKKATEETKLKMSILHKGNKVRAKKVINTKTSKIFDSLKEAASYYGINKSTLNAYLTNRNPNKTDLMYYSLIETIEKYKKL